MLTITCFVTQTELQSIITNQVNRLRGVIAGYYQVTITDVCVHIVPNDTLRQDSLSPIVIEVQPHTQLERMVFAIQLRDRILRAVPELASTMFDVNLQLANTINPQARHVP